MSCTVHRQCHGCGRKFSQPFVAGTPLGAWCNDCIEANTYDNKLGLQPGRTEGVDIEALERGWVHEDLLGL